MITYGLYILIFLVVLYFLIRSRNQILSFIGSLSLLLADISSAIIVKPILQVLQKNGDTNNDFIIILINVVTIVIVWGLIYAIFSNFNIGSFEKYSKYTAIVTSILLAYSLAIPFCFIGKVLNKEKFSSCAKCLIADVLYAPSLPDKAFVPKDLAEVYTLSAGTHIIRDDPEAKVKLLNLVNKERFNDQRPILAEDASLSGLASIYGKTIIDSLRFSHIDANNNTPDLRAKALNIEYTFLGENLAIAPDIESAHKSLMASVTHRNNILSSKYQKIGISCKQLSDGFYIIVEEFSN